MPPAPDNLRAVVTATRREGRVTVREVRLEFGPDHRATLRLQLLHPRRRRTLPRLPHRPASQPRLDPSRHPPRLHRLLLLRHRSALRLSRRFRQVHRDLSRLRFRLHRPLGLGRHARRGLSLYAARSGQGEDRHYRTFPQRKAGAAGGRLRRTHRRRGRVQRHHRRVSSLAIHHGHLRRRQHRRDHRRSAQHALVLSAAAILRRTGTQTAGRSEPAAGPGRAPRLDDVCRLRRARRQSVWLRTGLPVGALGLPLVRSRREDLAESAATANTTPQPRTSRTSSISSTRCSDARPTPSSKPGSMATPGQTG